MKTAILGSFDPIDLLHCHMKFVLFQRDECHLCDLALAVLAEAGFPEFDSVFIDEDVVLEAKYGMRVPVLSDADSAAELDWPFTAERVKAYLARLAS